jgi:alpha-N-arabinofuranosidase
MKIRKLALCGCLATATGAFAQTQPVISFDANAASPGTVYPNLFGANHRYGVNASGSADPTTGLTYSTLVSQIQDTGITMLRFPGGTMANTYRWSNAIGPQAQRKNQVNGSQAYPIPLQSTFGPDEFGNLLDQTGAVGNLVVNFATSTASDAAHFVAYMTAPQGSGVVDGVDWAALRATNGHPAPYDIKYVEVGNEMDVGGEYYWMGGTPVTIDSSCSSNKVPCLYSFGGATSFSNQQAVALDSWQSSAALSTGAQNQTFYTMYPPVVPNSQTIFVAGAAWTATASLSTAGPSDQVYSFNPVSGAITFGDGAHGAIPPSGSKIAQTYQSGVHDSFNAYYTAIKVANSAVKVCASTGVPNVLGSTNPYDCAVMHEYANTPTTTTNIDDFFGESMLGMSQLGYNVKQMRTNINNTAGSNAPNIDILISEYGMNGASPSFAPHFLRSMGEAVFQGLALTAWMNDSVPGAERHCLTDYTFSASPVNTGVSYPDNVLFGGPGPQTIATPSALAMKLFKNYSGPTLMKSQVTNNPTRTLTSGHVLSSLVPIASRDAAGNSYLIVTNEDPENAVTATVQPTNVTYSSTATVETLASLSITDENSPTAPTTVQLVDQAANVGSSSFQWTFPAHSITAIHFSPH